MNWDDIHTAWLDARSTLNRVDGFVNRMAQMCAGRLRKANVDSSVLKALKEELRDYNIHTSSWKQ